ncbi:uncharacterized protein DEA37_0010685, partial [Paragonimus westermani]
TIRSLEEEREALQLEYERLSERAPALASNNHVSSTPRQMQAQQQNQERTARMRLQQQQQDATRANMVGGYAPRMSMQRSPSASSPVPSVPSIRRLNSYSGRLRRAASASKKFNYPRELYGLEPRMCAYPYGSTLGPEFNLNVFVGTGELATEARLLREHRVRLDVRMQQLEQEMQRLRQHLRSGEASNTGTSAGTYKGSADLLFFDPSDAGTKSSLRQQPVHHYPKATQFNRAPIRQPVDENRIVETDLDSFSSVTSIDHTYERSVYRSTDGSS